MRRFSFVYEEGLACNEQDNFCRNQLFNSTCLTSCHRDDSISSYMVWPWLNTGFSGLSRTNRFGAYQTVPAKNQYSSAMKNDLESRTIQKSPYRTGMVRYGTVPVSFDWFSPVRVRSGLNNIAIGEGRILFSFIEPGSGLSMVRYHTSQ